MMDIWDWIDCEDCPRYKYREGRTWGDPDRCYPGESECSDGDFGNDRPCKRMLARIAEGLEDGDFGFSTFCLVTAGCLTDPEMKEGYGDVLGAWPDTDWSGHPYWQVFYDETAPVGFDTVEAVYAGVFS